VTHRTIVAGTGQKIIDTLKVVVLHRLEIPRNLYFLANR